VEIGEGYSISIVTAVSGDILNNSLKTRHKNMRRIQKREFASLFLEIHFPHSKAKSKYLGKSIRKNLRDHY
jgi:hypothetical protein